MIPKWFRSSILEPECHFLGVVPHSLNVHQMKERMETVRQDRVALQACYLFLGLSSVLAFPQNCVYMLLLGRAFLSMSQLACTTVPAFQNCLPAFSHYQNSGPRCHTGKLNLYLKIKDTSHDQWLYSKVWVMAKPWDYLFSFMYFIFSPKALSC